MKITINDHRKIFAIKEEFNKAFPSFKIEFFEKPSKAGGAHSEKKVKHDSETLGQNRSIHNKGTITIASAMTVGELRQNFRDVYELSINVFQKSGTGWKEAPENVILAES